MVNNNFEKKIKNITSEIEPTEDFIDFTDNILDSLEIKSQQPNINRYRRLPLAASFILIFLFIFLSPVYAELTSVFDSFKSLNIFNKENSDNYINTLNTTVKDSDLSFNFKNLVISGDSILLSYEVTTPREAYSLPGIWDSDIDINGEKIKDPLTEEYGNLISKEEGYTYDMVSIIDILDIKNLSENPNISIKYTIKNFDGIDGRWKLSLNLPKDKLYDKVYYTDTDKILKTSQGDIAFNEISLGQFYTKAIYSISNTDKDFKFMNYIIKTDKDETLFPYRGTSASIDGSSTGELYFSPIKEKPNKIWIIPYETNYDTKVELIKEIPAKDLINLPTPYTIKVSDNLTLNIVKTSYKNNNLEIKYKFDGICFDPHIVSLRYNDDTDVYVKYGFNSNLIRSDEGILTYEIPNLDDFKLKVVNQNHITPEFDKQIELSIK